VEPGGTLYYLLNLELTGFNPFGHAPRTASKEEMREQTSTSHQNWLRRLKEDPSAFPFDLATSDDMREEYLKDHQDSRVSEQAFSVAVSSLMFSKASESQIRTKSGKKHLKVIKNHEKYSAMSDAEKGREYDAQHAAAKPAPSTWGNIDLSEVRV